MKTIIFFLFSVTIFLGCEEENSPPTQPDENKATGYFRSYINTINWEATEIYASKAGSVINISAKKNSSEIQLQIININQIGNFSIGENEPGYTYFVKAKYIEKTPGQEDKIFKAYSRDYSVLEIKNISEGFLSADFVFIAYNSNFTDSVEVTNGALNINY